MKLTDNIEQAIRKKLNFTASAKMREKVLTDVINAHDDSRKTKSAIAGSNIRKIIMRNPITKLAAVIIIAMLVGLSFFNGNSSGVAWGDVARNVEQAKTVTFRLKTSMTGMPDSEIIVYDSSKYGSRMDVYLDGKITTRIYGTKDKNVSTIIIPDAKRYTRMSFTKEQSQHMREKEKDPRKFVKLFLSVEHTKLGRKTIDGIKVEGLEVDSPKVGGGMFERAIGRLWVDAKTELPVRMEIEGVSAGGKIQTKIIMDKFKWDEELSASEFEPKIPSDYILQTETKMPDVSEDKMIEGLRFFVEVSGGRYPSNMASMTAEHEIQEAWQKKYNRTPTNQELEKFYSLNAACQFYASLVEDNKEVEYYGDKVTTSNIDDELMRWRISEDEYRVIYGDLRTENVVDQEKLLNKVIELSGANIPPDKRSIVTRMFNLNEKDLIKGLGAFLEFSGGRYPSKLEAKTTIKEIDGLGKNLKMPQEEKKEKAQDIFFSAAFYEKLVREKKDVAYYGNKITVVDSGKVLMRWKISDDQYRIVFNNLTRKSVNAKELAELEN